jgi:tetratricopeptide (TPR) repeat protein
VFKDTEKALQDLDSAVQLEPNDYIAYKNRGAVRGMIGDFEGAVSDFNYCLSLGPPDVEEVQDMLEEALEGLKENEGGKRVRD